VKPPIFIYEPVDLLVFREVETALRYLEPPDVEKGVGVAFDSEGKVLTVRVEHSKETRGKWWFSKWWFKGTETPKIIIEESNEQPRADELKKVLVEFLSHPQIITTQRVTVGSLDNCSLPDLVARALHFEIKP
jgi:hypothetical protein